MAVFFSGVFNPNVFFTDSGAAPAVEVVKTGGKGDNRIFKPTGLIDRKKTPVEKRVVEASEDHAEIIAQLAREFAQHVAPPPVETMSATDIAAEIGARIREQIRIKEQKEREEDEETLILMSMIL